jgi:hypothetical protein
MEIKLILKSPVRKIRAPGFVQGLSGNWQSYRDARCHIGGEIRILEHSYDCCQRYAICEFLCLQRDKNWDGDLPSEVKPGHISRNCDPLDLVLKHKEQLYGSQS